MLIKGIGVDMVSIDRVRSLYNRFGQRFLAKILHADEKALCAQKIDPVPFLAKRWAGKEALLKALGTGMRAGLSWRDMAIVNDANGAPVVQTYGGIASQLEAIKASTVHISLSDEKAMAIAFVVIA
jgi:holo-[acyl-carrier protein] synthase